MSKKKLIAAGAVLFVAAGTVAAISAGPGRWQGQHGVGQGDGHDGMGRGGMFRREVTKEQYDARVRERFARLDKNSDGFIDASEIEAAGAERRRGMMERMRGAAGMGRGAGADAGAAGPGAGMRGEMMIRRFDTNKDGKVTKDEFLANVRKRFAERDLNSDGKISDDDLPPMMRGQNAIQRMASGEGRGGRGGMGGGGLLRDVEVKDGAITLDAVLAAAGRRFDLMDRNKDGAVDKADFDIIRKEMTDYRVKRFIHANGATKDGKVSREQFFAKANERFTEMDLNGDGKIGPGERMMGRGGHRMHGMRGGMGMDGPMMDGPMGGPMGPGGRPGPGMPPKQ